MSIDGLIFDLDGTITHTLPLCIQAFKEAIEPLAGRRPSDAEIIATFGPSEEGTIAALIPEHYDAGLSAYLAAYDRLINETHGPFPAMRDWLDSLKASGMRLALVTGKGANSTKSTLERFDLSQYFEHVATGSPKGQVKAERIAKIVSDWGLPPDRIAYVGDAPSDITAARKSGLRMISAIWDESAAANRDQLQALAPDVIAGSVAEAADWVRSQTQPNLIQVAQRLQALAQTGLTFTKDHYDRERYEELQTLAADLMAIQDDSVRAALLSAFAEETGYATPKVDTRAIILRENKVLMLREAEDGFWSLPGGWADVGDSPAEAVKREVREETGLEVSVTRLLGLWDRNQHGHPPYPYHAYKLFFLCEETGGELRLGAESLELGFFSPDALPPLSLTRVVPVEIRTSVQAALTQAETYFD